MFSPNDVPLILGPRALLLVVAFRHLSSLLKSSFAVGFVTAMILLEKVLIVSMGATGGNYTLMGLRFSIWFIPIIGFLLCILFRTKSKGMEKFAPAIAYAVCVALALVRVPNLVVDLVNGSGSIFVRFAEQAILTVSLTLCVVIPVSCFDQSCGQSEVDIAASRIKSSRRNSVVFGSLAYILVFVLGSIILQGTLFNYYLIVPVSALLKAIFLKSIYFHLIDQYLSFGLSSAILFKWSSDKSDAWLEIVLLAGLYAMLHYYLMPGYLVWKFCLGLPLAWMYRQTGKLRYGIVLATIFDIFTQ